MKNGYDSMDSELSNKCREFCGESNDCFAEIFEFSEIRVGRENGIFTIVIMAQTIPSFIFTHWLKIRFEVFLFFITNIINL
jgi:hypothetical protein